MAGRLTIARGRHSGQAGTLAGWLRVGLGGSGGHGAEGGEAGEEREALHGSSMEGKGIMAGYNGELFE